MTDQPGPATGPLHGMCIVLSGSIPEREHWRTATDDRAILEFVRDFAGLVFKHGGRLVHGCHPSLTPVLVQQAERFGPLASGQKPLTLLMSERWAKDLPPAIGAWYEQHADFQVVRREAAGSDDPEGVQASLTLLRRELVSIGNVMVTIGGKHQGLGKGAGVEEEVSLAIANRLPTFLLGGFGGRTAKLPATWHQALASAGDHLPDATRASFARSDDVVSLLGRLIAHLVQHRDQLLAFAHRDIRTSYATYVQEGFRRRAPQRARKKMLEAFMERVTERTTSTANTFASALRLKDTSFQKRLIAAMKTRAASSAGEVADIIDASTLNPIIDKLLIDQVPKALRQASAGDEASLGDE